MSRSARLVVTFALIAHLLVGLAMAALPRLHEAIHHDTHEGDHECEATLILSGALENAAPPAVPTRAWLQCVWELKAEAAPKRFVASFEGLIQERAPPGAAI